MLLPLLSPIFAKRGMCSFLVASVLFLLTTGLLAGCRTSAVDSHTRDATPSSSAAAVRTSALAAWRDITNAASEDEPCLLQVGRKEHSRKDCQELLGKRDDVAGALDLSKYVRYQDGSSLRRKRVAFCEAVDHLTNVQGSDERIVVQARPGREGTFEWPNPLSPNWLWVHHRCTEPAILLKLSLAGYLPEHPEAPENAFLVRGRLPVNYETFRYYARFGKGFLVIWSTDGRHIRFFADNTAEITALALEDPILAGAATTAPRRLALQVRASGLNSSASLDMSNTAAVEANEQSPAPSKVPVALQRRRLENMEYEEIQAYRHLQDEWPEKYAEEYVKTRERTFEKLIEIGPEPGGESLGCHVISFAAYGKRFYDRVGTLITTIPERILADSAYADGVPVALDRADETEVQQLMTNLHTNCRTLEPSVDADADCDRDAKRFCYRFLILHGKPRD